MHALRTRAARTFMRRPRLVRVRLEASMLRGSCAGWLRRPSCAPRAQPLGSAEGRKGYEGGSE
jgi:hypothetical protein